MAAITWEDVAGHAPELRRLSTRAQTDILALANDPTYLNVTNFGGEDTNKLRLARIYLAAHFGTMDRRRGIPGAVSSTALGPASRSYAHPADWRTFLQATSYGMNLATMMRTSPARAGALLC